MQSPSKEGAGKGDFHARALETIDIDLGRLLNISGALSLHFCAWFLLLFLFCCACTVLCRVISGWKGCALIVRIS